MVELFSVLANNVKDFKMLFSVSFNEFFVYRKVSIVVNCVFLSVASDQMSFSVMCKRIEVRLVRDAEYGTFGMTLRGGASKDPRKCRPLTVTQLRLGGPAER